MVSGGAGVDIGGQRLRPSAVRRHPILGEGAVRSPGREDSSVRAAGVAAPGPERRLPARRLQAALLAHRGGVRRRLHGHTRTASGVAGAGGGVGGGGLVLPVADAPARAEASPDRAGRPGGGSWRRDVRLPLLPAAVSRGAQRVGGRDPLHSAQYPLHAARLRPRPGGSPGVPGRRGADRRRPPGQRRHGQEHPAVELSAAVGDLRTASANPHLLRVRGRGQRSLRSRRHLPSGDALGPRTPLTNSSRAVSGSTSTWCTPTAMGWCTAR